MSDLFVFAGDNTDNAQKADVRQLGYVGSTPQTKKAGRDSDSWYTPLDYINSARAAMGSIDLDPFSSDLANKNVRATRYHTEQSSCLAVDWDANPGGTVWMNPPYGPLCRDAVDKFIEQWSLGNFTQGIILVNNSTDTQWFKKLADHASAFCFTDHRISFTAPDNKALGGNTRGQVFIYFGKDTAKFKAEFAKHGLVLSKA